MSPRRRRQNSGPGACQRCSGGSRTAILVRYANGATTQHPLYNLFDLSKATLSGSPAVGSFSSYGSQNVFDLYEVVNTKHCVFGLHVILSSTPPTTPLVRINMPLVSDSLEALVACHTDSLCKVFDVDAAIAVMMISSIKSCAMQLQVQVSLYAEWSHGQFECDL